MKHAVFYLWVLACQNEGTANILCHTQWVWRINTCLGCGARICKRAARGLRTWQHSAGVATAQVDGDRTQPAGTAAPAIPNPAADLAGKKKVYTTTAESLLFSSSSSEASVVYTLLSGPMVYTLFPCFPRKRVYTIPFLLCDLRAGRQTEKRGVPRWWCILFFPWPRAGWWSQSGSVC